MLGNHIDPAIVTATALVMAAITLTFLLIVFDEERKNFRQTRRNQISGIDN
jgi:hypothetical protein